MNAPLAQLVRLVGDLAREPDGRLLDAFLAGSQHAFRELVTRHGSLVFAVCNRILHHRQDAEDAFQAVFLVLARRAADVWPRDAVGPWLYGVAYRVALKARTMRIRKQGREQPLEDVPEEAPGNLEPDAAEVIDRVVRRLPEMYRAAVVACDLEGLSRRDAAARLGWKEGTLSGRLARARQLLADRLRKAGLSLPAAGLAATLGTNAPVRAGLTEAVMGVAIGNAAAGVPAPVAALTEGVVSSMFAFKLKALAAAVVLACGLGYGAWAAGGGDGLGAAAGSSAQAAVPQSKAQPQTKPKAVPPPPKLAAGLEPLQGQWRVVSVVDGKGTRVPDKDEAQEFEFSGNAMFMPFRDASIGWRKEKYAIAVDPDQNPKTIDLSASGKPVGRGIYELIGPMQMCATCHNSPFDNLKPTELVPLCAPVYKHAAGKQSTVLRLALAIEGGRPTKFGGGTRVLEYRLERVTPDDEGARLELNRLQFELFKLKDHPDGVRKAEAERLAVKIEVLKLKLLENEARHAVEVARAECDRAQAEVVKANLQFTIASRNLQDAQDKLAAAEKNAAKLADPKRPSAKDSETFSVHIRTLLAAEKVIRVKATGNETVLEGLAYAAEDMAIKADALSVWVVRDKTVLPVDLAGITQNGETRTNYQLKPGDQLFVQAKAGK